MEIIAEAAQYYQRRATDADADRRKIHRLGDFANAILHSGAHMGPHAVARYNRSRSTKDILRTKRPGAFGHWAEQYLQAIKEPSDQRCHNALESIAEQTASKEGKHTPGDAALFTAAASQLVAIIEEIPQRDRADDQLGWTSTIELADAIARTDQADKLHTDLWRQLVQKATHMAIQNVIRKTHRDGADHKTALISVDSLGRTRYLTPNAASLQRAKRLAKQAIKNGIATPSHPNLIKLNQIATEHGPAWNEQSIQRCAFDAVCTSINYTLAEPSRLTPQQLNTFQDIALQVIDQHTTASNQDDQATTASQREASAPAHQENRDLIRELDEAMREHNPWFDSTLNFNEHSRPDERAFKELEELHSKQMHRHADIIAKASTITLPELAEQRDAIIIAAAGTINWQCREEFDMYERHTLAMGPHRTAAFLQRLHNASEIIRAMPDTVLPSPDRNIILNHDQERRQKILADTA